MLLFEELKSTLVWILLFPYSECIRCYCLLRGKQKKSTLV